MFCREFSHIGIGDTGEGVVRNAIVNYLARPIDGSEPRITVLNGDAHLSTKDMPPEAGPAFTFVRNPYDWYISFWIHELKTHRATCDFGEWYKAVRPWGFYGVFQWACDGIPLERIGKFENLEQDLARILPLCWSGITSEEVLSWFPEAYRQWRNRPWIEGIEQHMRMDIYRNYLSIVDDILDQDAWLMDTFKYDITDVYDFSSTKGPQ